MIKKRIAIRTIALMIFISLALSFSGCQKTVPLPPIIPTQTTPFQTNSSVYFTPVQSAEILSVYTSAIAGAQDSVEIAMYNLTHAQVADALIEAAGRGVTIRIVTEADNMDGEQIYRLQQAGIPIVGDTDEGLMHNKFTIIDATELWLGSLNLTYNGLDTDDNCMVRLISDKAVRDYQTEFDEMFFEHHFGSKSPSNTPYSQWVEENIPMEVYFSPDDNVNERLLVLINDAQVSIDMLAYSFTLDSLAEALVHAFQRGLAVRIVFDAAKSGGDAGSEYDFLVSQGLDVRMDGDEGAMHQKTVIIDGTIVEFGSYNFTSAAEKKNDENIMIIHDAWLAGEFSKEFERIYDRAIP